MGLPNIGPMELIIILAIALLIVGPRRLPEMGSAFGRTIREFRKATSEVTEASSLKPEERPVVPPPSQVVQPVPSSEVPAVAPPAAPSDLLASPSEVPAVAPPAPPALEPPAPGEPVAAPVAAVDHDAPRQD